MNSLLFCSKARCVITFSAVLILAALAGAEAIDELRAKAAEGDPASQNSLGVAYRDGEGVAVNRQEAIKWLSLAAEQGDALAQFNLAACYDLTVFKDGKDIVLAEKWYRKAAEQEQPLAQFALAEMYRVGDGVPRDYSEAARWYLKAAAHGNTPSYNNLGVLYDEGLGLSQDSVEAAKWYTKAADEGIADAQLRLGDMYRLGLGVAQSATDSARMYLSAANQGLSMAQYNLGVCYNVGFGVSKSRVLAYAWWKLSTAQKNENAKSNLKSVIRKMTDAEISEADEKAKEFSAQVEKTVTNVPKPR